LTRAERGVVAGGTVVRASAGGGGDGDGQVVQLVLEFEDDALGGLFADAGMRVRVAWSPERMAVMRRSAEMPLRTVMASLGPMPLMVRSFSKRRFSWVSEKPKRAI